MSRIPGRSATRFSSCSRRATRGAALSPLVRAFDDVNLLFEGNYPGYLRCDTLYHDARHTLDMTLAMARLIDGHDRVHPGADALGARRAVLGVVIALLHDSGYMRRSSESHVENGAIFTKVHVSRSADFLARYLPTIGYGAEAEIAARLVHFTGYEMDVDDIKVAEPKDRMLGAADRYADAHFDGPSLYQSEIDSNMSYLRQAIETADLNRLRRTCYSLSRTTSKAA